MSNLDVLADVSTQILARMAHSRIDTAELAAHLDMGEDTLVGRLTARTVFTVPELVRAGELLGATLTDFLTR